MFILQIAFITIIIPNYYGSNVTTFSLKFFFDEIYLYIYFIIGTIYLISSNVDLIVLLISIQH